MLAVVYLQIFLTHGIQSALLLLQELLVMAERFLGQEYLFGTDVGTSVTEREEEGALLKLIDRDGKILGCPFLTEGLVAAAEEVDTQIGGFFYTTDGRHAELAPRFQTGNVLACAVHVMEQLVLLCLKRFHMSQQFIGHGKGRGGLCLLIGHIGLGCRIQFLENGLITGNQVH